MKLKNGGATAKNTKGIYKFTCLISIFSCLFMVNPVLYRRTFLIFVNRIFPVFHFRLECILTRQRSN
jgi:hypothetical protein